MNAAILLDHKVITRNQCDEMLKFWAAWSFESKGHAWSDERINPPIYQGAEPYPDTSMICERCLGWMLQTEIGKMHFAVLWAHYKLCNLPIDLRIQFIRKKQKRRDIVSETRYYEMRNSALDAFTDAVQRHIELDRPGVKC